jgi:tyrosinase
MALFLLKSANIKDHQTNLQSFIS